MKVCYTLLVCLLAVLPISLYAQPCPPPGFPQPGNTCPLAPILCENLDGYCATINNNNTAQNFPGCAGWQLNNDEWFAFFAGTTSISIQVIPSSCSTGGMMGLQGGIYQACGPPWTPVDLQCACTTNPFILESTNFVVGQVYYFVLDGCAGNVCNYTIDVLSGSTVGVPPDDPGPITGSNLVCAGTATPYSVATVTAATIYNWTLNPPTAGTINGTGKNINITWANDASGTAELCLAVSNLCYSNPDTVCKTIQIVPKPTATLSGSGLLCAGSGGTVDLTVTFTGEGPWTFVYRRNGVNQPPITTNDNPYTLTVNQPGTYTLQSVNTVTNNCAGTVSGNVVITQTTITATAAVTAASCGQSNGAINLTVGGNGNPPYMFDWSNDATSEDLANIPGGTYTVTITDEDGCTKTVEATVPDNQVNLNISGTVLANTTCNGGNGSIDISVTPGGLSYTYEWSTTATTQDINNLVPGTYTVTVTTGLTCTASAEFTVADNPNEPNLSATTVSSTCDLSNGSINLSVSGGVAPYTYEWAPNMETTQDLSNIPAGDYTVTVTGNNGCTRTLSVTVNNNNPTFNVTGSVVASTTCNGNGNGSINVTVTPNGSYTYIWSTTATTQDINNLLPGTYTITVSAGGSCTDEAEFTVPDDPLEPIVNTNVTNTTCDLSNGSINASASGGVAPYTYIWSSGQSTATINNLLAGTYTVTVTGANGCTAEREVTVDNNNPNFNVTAVITSNTTCNANSNGNINVSVSPNGSYTYLWSTTATTQDIGNLAPGTYTLTVSAGGSCTQEQEFTVPDDPIEPNVNANVTPATCDLTNGNASASASGGVGPYTYAWSNGFNTQIINNLLAGTYTVTVTGANGCTGELEVDVPNNQLQFNITGVETASTTCNGNGNGSINVSVSPNGSYTYVWSTTATTQDINNLAPGTYTITVSAGGTCTDQAEFTVPEDPLEPNINTGSVPSTCDLANGSVTASANSGVAPYTYHWSSGQNTATVNNLLAGTYTVTVTGANGCTSEEEVFLDNNNPSINISGNVVSTTTCNGNGNGSISITVLPTGTYTYQWSNNATTKNISNLASGTYTVTVSGGGSCTETAEFFVPEDPNEPNLSFAYVDPRCELANGSINLSVSGSTLPYSYNWSSGQTSQDLNNIPSGTYTVIVTGGNGCTAEGEVILSDDYIQVTIDGTVTPKTSCITNNGKIVLSLTPANVTVTWSNNATTTTLNNLPPGTYTVTVSAGGVCTETAEFTIEDETELPTLETYITPSTCGFPNGIIDLDVFGGVAPYTYLWSNGIKTQDLNNVPAGNYAVTVTTSLGCSAVTFASVPGEDIIIDIFGAISDNISCTQPNGYIDIDPSPPRPYTYNWSNGKKTQDITGLTAGTYTVTVTWGTCSAEATFDVLDNVVLPNLSMSNTPTVCSQTNGSATVTPGGATAPYTYLWSNTLKTATISNIAAGTYTVTVTDFYGCSATATTTVFNTTIAVNISGLPAANTSCSTPNGSIDVSVAPAGTTYTYTWSTTANTQDVANLAAGSYTVTASAGIGCTASATFAVPNNTSDPDLSATVTASICSLSNGAIDLGVSGAVPPYTYAWSNLTSNEDLTNIPSGNYTVTVTGANGCTADTTLNVANNASTFSLSGTALPLNNCKADNGAIDLTVTPAGVYTYSWSNFAVTQDISNLPAGAYTVSVTEIGDCTATATFFVDDERTYPATTQSVVSEICSLTNGSIDLGVSGGQPPYVFQWSNTAGTEDLLNIPGGTYTVTVTGANDCTATTSATVPNNPVNFALSGVTAPLSSCAANNGAIDLTVTPATPGFGLSYTYAWSNSSTTQDLNGIFSGDYTVTVSAGGSCTLSTTFSVDNTTEAPNISQSIFNAACGQSTGGINLNISGSTTPYTYKWSTTATTQDISGVPAGTYTVTVTGANGCSSVEMFVIPDDVIVPDISGIITANTSCVVNNGGINIGLNPANLPYTFKWSNGPTTQNLVSIAPGLYTVTVYGGGGCTATASFTVANDTEAPIPTGTLSAALCGQSSGGIDLSVSAGITPYSFKWSNSALIEDLANVLSGPYTVTVTGANGCSNTASFTVPENTVIPVISATPTPNTSCVAGNGAIAISVTPVTLTYTYAWNGGPTTPNLSDLDPGTYTVTVNGGGACIATATVTVANNTNAPLLSGTPTDAVCGQSNGSFNLTATGGLPPYSFQWSNSFPGEDLVNVPSGNYTVTATGANGCANAVTFTVPEFTIIPVLNTAPTANTSCAAGNGAIDLSVTPTTLPYTYKWSGNQTTQDIANLAPGTYTVTVNGGGACTATATVNVPNGIDMPGVSGATTDVLCFGKNTGAIDVTVTGGTAPFTYKWLPAAGGNLQDLTNIPAGNYALTVSDPMGCTATAVFTIQQPPTAVQIQCTQSANVSMPGATDGAADIDISGGVPPYAAVWTPGGNQTGLTAGVFAIPNLGVGSYAVTVTDANGCTALCNFDIKIIQCDTRVGTMSGALLSHCDPGCLTATYNNLNQFLEPGDVFQFILHQGSGTQVVNEIARSNQPTFCFDPAKMNYGATYYISAAAGNNDGSGNVNLAHFCTVVSVGTPIVFHEKPEAAIAPPPPIDCATLQAPLAGSSDLPGSTFTWSTQGGTIVGNPANAAVSASAAGTYRLIVASNGCFDTAVVQVLNLTNQPQAKISFDPSDILDCTISQIILSGDIKGTSDANTVWLYNGNVYAGGTVITIDAAGVYEFVILDTITKCTDKAVIEIGDNLAYPPLFLNPPGILSCRNSSVTLSGGSPLPGINFTWARVNGTDTVLVGSGASLPVNVPGVYLLIGEDPVNHCRNALNTFVDSDLSLPVANAGTPFSLYCFGQSATLDGSGSTGEPGLTFFWSTVDGDLAGGIGTPKPVIEEPGTYTLLVSNPGNGCTDTDEVVIDPLEPLATAKVKDPRCVGDRGYIVIDTVFGAKPPVRYTLNDRPPVFSNLFTGLPPGDYSILVEGSDGCKTTLDVTIEAPQLIKIDLLPQVVIHLGDDYLINAGVSLPPSEIQSVQWTPSTNLACDTCLSTLVTQPLNTVQYHLTVVNKTGCDERASLLLVVDKERNVYVPNIFSPDGDGENDLFTIYAENQTVEIIKSFQIYSRWGEQVYEHYNFQPNSTTIGWDGKHRGQDMNPAVFVWYAVIRFIDGEEVLYKGDITLKR